jgi:SAM-dependent methyltransferase
LDHNLNVYNDFHYEYTDAHLYPPEIVILGKLRDHWHRMSILDIGIGTGRTTHTFANISRKYLGVDYSERMLERCRELARNTANCSLKCLDARDLSQLYGSGFDFVLFSLNGLDSLDHAGREKALQEIRKVLAPNGYFFFSTHSLSTFAESRRLPVFRWKSPIRSAYYLSKALWFNFRLKRANSESEGSIRAQDWAVLKTGDHDFRIDIYHIQPQVQLNELARLGYRVESVLDDRGEEVDPVHSGSPWLYYLCRLQPS